MSSTRLPACPVEGFSIVENIGSGGNGDVFRIKNNESGDELALKILRNINKETIQRFYNEIKILSECKISGIIPILEFNLPEVSSGTNTWYTMPLATNFGTFIKEKSIVNIVNEFLPLIQTLIELHDSDIVHRDIKPDNFLYYNNRLCLADFGLVKFPESPQITPERRDVGAKFTMAPEMRRQAFKANGKQADIYSIAKSLWIAITRQELGFDGQYIKGSSLSLTKTESNLYFTPLEDLLEQSTDNTPENRPTAQEFKSQLEHWLEINEDFDRRNLTEWLEIQNILFPSGVPVQAEWKDVSIIVKILNHIAHRDSLNHMFYPDGGGNDLVDVKAAGEKGFISLYVCERSADIIKPKKLTFNSFGSDPEWNYFWLECEEVEPHPVSSSFSYKGFNQYLTELSPGVYTLPDAWEHGEYNGNPLPTTAVRVDRYIKGTFVFFSKSSRYNKTRRTYENWQNMGEEKFRDLIKSAAERHSE